MEALSQLLNTQFLFPATAVIAVLVCAIGVFAFGFKSAEQPAFDKLSSSSADDRKPAGKKRKIKEKRSTANGHATAVTEGAEVKASPSKKAAPVKEASKETPSKLTKKPEPVAAAPKASKTTKAADGKVVEVKNKKNLKQKQPEEKPLDYDDGTWETVPVKNDKKNRKTQDEPIIVKKDSPKKILKKGQDKNKKPNVDEQKDVDVLEHVIDNKEEVTKELKDKVNEQQKAAAVVEKNIEVMLTPVVIPEAEPEPEAAVTEDSVVVTDDAKKKKNKKAKAKVDSGEVTKVVLPQSEAVPKKEKKEKKEKTDVVRPAKAVEQVEVKSEPVTVPDKGVAFDELGDVWTEAKVPKKNKKKVRKE